MITCSNKECDFKAINFKGIQYNRYAGENPKCPRCGADLHREPCSLPPNLRQSVIEELSCPNCRSFDRTTICTGFGARLEGTCRIYTAGLVSYGDTCDAIDVDDDWVAGSIFKGIKEMPATIRKKVMDMIVESLEFEPNESIGSAIKDADLPRSGVKPDGKQT